MLILDNLFLDPYTELLDVFRYYDKENKGVIPKDVLIEQLTTVSEPLTKEQIEEVFHSCGCNEDTIDYNAFVQELLK